MKSNVIKTGDKVEIRILQQVEKGRRLGEYPPAYRSIVENVQEDGSMELLLPIVKGKIDAPPPTASGLRLCFIPEEECIAVLLRLKTAT